ncbi:hypothetical protein CKAH01_18437 [Colletotrichum kahawae]|uniref:F-box domain-containing protein n=1 Tax=Colletotrichum kahawae TaxID=34407 RepID=A0AAE0D350_COLKA|nr:hypothetical protein CKAH01_18437 [Colletotrichum kahawae]
MLENLPPELLYGIFDACGDRQTQFNLSRCSRTFQSVFRPLIYRRNVQSEDCSAARWAVLHCRRQDVALRVVEASVCAGMDIWASQFEVMANDIFTRQFVTRLPLRLRTSLFRLSLFALSVLKRREEIVVSLLDTQSDAASYRERLLASELTAYLKKLTNDGSVMDNHLTPLHVASATGLDVLVKQILKDAPAAVEATDACGRTPLCYAIRCPLTAVSTIQLLLRHQAEVNDYTVWRGHAVSLLEFCCEKGLFSFAVCLLEHGARGDLQHLFRLTLLASSTTLPSRASWNRATLIRRLIQRGANPNGVVRAAGIDERSLLLDLALSSPSATKRLLALPDVDVNIQDSSGWTALSRLLLQSHPNCKTVALLLKRGAKLQPHSFDEILRLSTFWSLKELMTMLSRHANTFDLFCLLYKHCESHTTKDTAMVCFLASAAPQSRVLARMPDSDLRDIRRGNAFLLMHYFDFALIPLEPTS